MGHFYSNTDKIGVRPKFRNVLGGADKSNSTDEAVTIAPKARNFFYLFLQKVSSLSNISGKASLYGLVIKQI